MADGPVRLGWFVPGRNRALSARYPAVTLSGRRWGWPDFAVAVAGGGDRCGRSAVRGGLPFGHACGAKAPVVR